MFGNMCVMHWNFDIFDQLILVASIDVEEQLSCGDAVGYVDAVKLRSQYVCRWTTHIRLV